MKTKDYNRFVAALGIEPPSQRTAAAMAENLGNWYLLHPELAKLKPASADLRVIRQYMYIELDRDGGPRMHIMDRLYKRFSNLRREMETTAMAACIDTSDEYGLTDRVVA